MALLNVKDMQEIRDRMAEFDIHREILIKKGRDIVKLSKQIIYSVHRNEMGKATSMLNELKSLMVEQGKIVEKNPKLTYTGSFRVDVQEYVEAVCYYEFVKNGTIPSHKDLNVGGEYYLLGLCDLTGELIRKAINSGIDADYDKVLKIRELVGEIYGEMLKFDFRNGELRKKFDGIKYDLKKIEDLVLELKLSGKV
jgi:predicted translin family RNA/ssDNA-binding protein